MRHHPNDLAVTAIRLILHAKADDPEGAVQLIAAVIDSLPEPFLPVLPRGSARGARR